MSTRTRYRASQVIIDTPHVDDEILINLSVQKVDINTEDNTALREYPRTEYIHKIASSILTENVIIFGPVIGTDITISVAGLHLAIQECVIHWIKTEHPEYVVEGDLIWES
jgi:hypothetical protein